MFYYIQMYMYLYSVGGGKLMKITAAIIMHTCSIYMYAIVAGYSTNSDFHNFTPLQYVPNPVYTCTYDHY